MNRWEGSTPPAHISYLFATLLGHFGAPFLLPAHIQCLEQCLDAGEALRTAFRSSELCLEEIGIALPIPMV